MGKEKRKTQSTKTATDRAVAIVCLLLALVIAAVLVITVLNETGVILRVSNATTIGEGENKVKVDKAMMAYFLNTEIMSAYNSAAEYAEMYKQYGLDLGVSYFLGYDPSYDLSLQDYSETQTWYDYYVERAKTSVTEVVVYAHAAKQAGLTIDEAAIDAEIEEIKAELKAQGASFSDWYGKGVSESDVRRCLELTQYAIAFLEHKQENVKTELDAGEEVSSIVKKYVEDNKTSFYSATVLKHSVTVSEKNFISEAAYDRKVEIETRFAKYLKTAKTAAEYMAMLENKSNKITELGKEYDAEQKAKETTAGAKAAETEKATEKATESTTEKATLSYEELVEKYDEEITYNEGTDALNDWLFGDTWASEGEINYFTENSSETVTEKATTTEKETKTETETAAKEEGTSASTGAKADDKSNSSSDKKTETKRIFKITTYFVLDACDLDHEYTHDFGFLIVSDKAIAEAIKESFANGTKSLDNFYNLAEAKHNSLHGTSEHSHSDTFDFNKVEQITAGAFENAYGSEFSVVDDWIESTDRKAGDVSDIIEIVTTSGTGDTKKEIKTYALIYFDKENTGEKGESWYPSALSATVSSEVEKWYNAQTKPVFNDSNLKDIPTIVIVTQ